MTKTFDLLSCVFYTDMTTVSFSVQAFLKKKLLLLSQIPQTTTNHRPFSSHKLGHTPRTKRLDKALRVLDIIAPKTGLAPKHHNHLRLIQDFLRTDSDQTFRKHFREDFIAQKSVEGVSCLFDDIIESSVPEKEDSDAKLKNFEVGVLSNAVSSCVSMRDVRGGIQYHCFSIISGFVANIYVGSSLITLYAKCGELESAYKVFEEMPVRNVVTWTAVISGFAQEWQIDVCLELYSSMRNSALEPNDFTFTSLLSACTGSGALGQGRSIHCQIIQMGFDSYLHIANALVSMYCKCGNVGDALYIFENMGGKDTVSWNSMIAGYAQHGLAAEAIELFEKMKTESVKPDAFTFLGVLSSCRHAGFVDAGRKYFNSMAEYSVKPELDHYSCLIDLLGRAGLLEEARDLIEKMPVSPNAIIWGTLLSACRLHGSVWIGIQAAENRLLLEPECAATHVQLANLYASVRCWDQAARVRKSMKDKGLKTNPGCSWIEIKNEVYRFRVEDKSTTKVGEILAVLDSLLDHMMKLGHGPEIQEPLVNDN